MRQSQKARDDLLSQRIQQLVAEIADIFHPEKIILFGSHAYGAPTRDSDVDLLVIMQTKRRPVEQAVAIRQAVHFPFPTDLLVRTPAQVTQRLRSGDFFLQEILSRGKVIYEAPHP